MNTRRAETTRALSRVALATCAKLPDLDDDDRLLLPVLRALGVVAEPAVWDDPGVDWTAYDLVVPRSTWDYPHRRDEFVAWARSVPSLANSADVIAWNTDKRYLVELADAGVPVVPTERVDAGVAWTPDDRSEVVIKPAIGAGSIDTGRYDLGDSEHRRLAGELVGRLHARGRAVLVQPYLHGVDTEGETALMFFAGEFSHAVRKGPMLTGPDTGQTGLYKAEEIVPRNPSPEQLEVSRRALLRVPRQTLYARVDLIPGPDGGPVVVELELTEPSLFLGHGGDGAVKRFAEAIARLSGVH